MNLHTQIEVKHVVIASAQSYEKVLTGLSERLGSIEGWHETDRVSTTLASWEQMQKVVESNVGTSGFMLFNTVEHTPLLKLQGKNSRAIQYLVGNPLLAVQMSSLLPEVALYAPLSFVVYEDETSHTFVAYDDFVTLLAQYQHAEVTRVAQGVAQKFEALLTAVTQK